MSNKHENRLFYKKVLMITKLHSIFLLIFIILGGRNFSLSQPLAETIFTFSPTKFNRLDGSNLPSDLKTFSKLLVRACKGESEPLSLLINAEKEKISNVEISWTDFKSETGIIPKQAMEAYIAKVWYQAGVNSNEVNNKILTQELLLKNDTLIKVDSDLKRNFLLVKRKSGIKEYIDISNPEGKFPDDIIIEDSKNLLPFSVEKNSNKQIWFGIDIPSNAKPGTYNSICSIKSDLGELKTFPISIIVLPFALDASRITYGIYYHGRLDSVTAIKRPFHFSSKSRKQLITELKDMRSHGIDYPTLYSPFENVEENLIIRNSLGFPQDKLFQLGLRSGNPNTQSGLDTLKQKVKLWKALINKFGYKELYVYGIDEAKDERLRSEIPAWKAIHEAGGKVFVAVNQLAYKDVADVLDVAVSRAKPTKIQAEAYHKYGNKIFSYANPHSGEENPEIYRRNYGITLLQTGYDGYMDYAYQKSFGSFWNDFDSKRHREETFTYPINNGIILTIQWEGLREGIDDVKYVSTLLNKMDILKAQGKNIAIFEEFINSINSKDDLDETRNKIIDMIILSLSK